MLPDTAAVYPHWRQLVMNLTVSGVQVHDARLVAFMLVHGVTHILTLNPGDFARYSPLVRAKLQARMRGRKNPLDNGPLAAVRMSLVLLDYGLRTTDN